MKTLSLCMIVKNEQEVLARCLQSARDVFDELVIVDTGSTDATIEISGCFGAEIIEEPWRDDFSHARNLAFSGAKMQYVFWLDADDVLPETTRQKLLEWKAAPDDGANTVMMPYHAGYDAQGRLTLTYDRERIFRRSTNPKWVGAVHEAIMPTAPVTRLEAPIEHRKLKAVDNDRNLRIYERLRADGLTFSARDWFYYARELMAHGKMAQAQEGLEHFLACSGGWIENRLEAWQSLAQCCSAQDDPLGALDAYMQALAQGGTRASLCCNIGKYWMNLKRWDLAQCWYETALRQKPGMHAGAFEYLDCYDYIPLLQLCVCHDRMGQIEKAKQYHSLALARFPNDPACRLNEHYFSTK